MTKAKKMIEQSIPAQSLTWNMYGAGMENIGRDDKPELFDIPQPKDDQMLVRIDAVSLCFSDYKLILQGGNHPKLYGRDLNKEPGRLGHEAVLTIMKVGRNLQNQFQVGERYAVQPDIYQNGMSTAYGYTIPGGLIQYHLMGKEMLETDHGTGLLKVSDKMGIAEAALLEPWGCVWAAYTQRRRLTPKEDGVMWIIGQPQMSRNYTFTNSIGRQSTVILTNVPSALAEQIRGQCAQVIIRDNLNISDYQGLSQELTDGNGFDDIVVLEPHSAEALNAISKLIARRGTMNMMGQSRVGLVDADVGRLHYDYIAFIGNAGTEIADSYGEARNRCDLMPEGVAVFVGSGGPMGQMHVQRAIEMANGPKTLIVTDVNDQRLAEIESRFAALTAQNGCTLYTFNPTTAKGTLYDFVMMHTGSDGADDVVVNVPNAQVMKEAATLMNQNGMLVLFAGVPNGTLAPVDLSDVYLNNMQYTGTSGLTIEDQRIVMENAVAGNIAPAVCVAAISGMNAAKEGLQAMIDSKYPGKILVFPQIVDMPLYGLDELKDVLPDVAAQLGAGNTWTVAAERALFAAYGIETEECAA